MKNRFLSPAQQTSRPATCGSSRIEDEIQGLFERDNRDEMNSSRISSERHSERETNDILGLRGTARLSFEFCILWVCFIVSRSEAACGAH